MRRKTSSRPYIVLWAVVVGIILISTIFTFTTPSISPDSSKASENVTTKILTKVSTTLDPYGLSVIRINTNQGEFFTYPQVAVYLKENVTYSMKVYPQKNNRGYNGTERWITEYKMISGV